MPPKSKSLPFSGYKKLLDTIFKSFFSYVALIAFTGLLTKSGYITKMQNRLKLYTNNSYIMPSLSKLKRIKCNQDIFVQSWGFMLFSCNWSYDLISHNQWKSALLAKYHMHCGGLLLTTTCPSLSAGMLIFLPQWQAATGQLRTNYKLLH